MTNRLLSVVMIFCLSVCAVNADPITLTGTVVFKGTAEPAKGAAVYLDGTSAYALTDETGRYSLTVPQRLNTSLIVRHTEYTNIIDNPFESLPDTVFMDIRLLKLPTVVVRYMPYERKDLMKFFREQFLGMDVGAMLCEIENQDDITFSWDESKKIVMATCDNPLRINNRFLGYTLIFDLHYFVSQLRENSLYGLAYTVYFGTCSFIDTSNGEKKFDKMRDEAYRTSFRSLINSILSDDIGSSGFWVMRGPHIKNLAQTGWTVSDTLSMKKIVIGKPAVKTEIHKGNYAMAHDGIKVQYKTSNALSSIFFLADSYMVDSYGNVDNIPALMFTGNMSEKKVGNMLPMDYVPLK